MTKTAQPVAATAANARRPSNIAPGIDQNGGAATPEIYALNSRQQAILRMQQTQGNAAVCRFLNRTQHMPIADHMQRYPAAPSGSPYASVPAPLAQTVQDSLDDRRNHVAGADQYLTYFGGMDAATTVWDALDRMPPSFVDMFIEIHLRATAAGLSWAFFGRLLNSWLTTSRGFRFRCPDVGGLRAALNTNTHFCRDRSRVSALWHDGECWREVVPGGAVDHGLHICLVDGDIQSIHMDMHMPVDHRDAAGECSFNYVPGVLQHGIDILLQGNPPNIFERQERDVKRIDTMRQEYSTEPATITQLNTLQNRLQAMGPDLRRMSGRTHMRSNASEEADNNSPLGRQISDVERQINDIEVAHLPPSMEGVGF
ncbi:MAG: hypothetical protein ACYDEO_27805 [Aggregatilineales bacterium]